RGANQGGFHRDMAASPQGFAWPRDIGLSLRLHLSGIRGWFAVATHRRNRCSRVASLVSILVAVLPTARFLPRIHRRRLLGRVSDRGNARSVMGAVHLVRDELGQAKARLRRRREWSAHREGVLWPRLDPIWSGSFHLLKADGCAGGRMAAMACGMGVS